MNQICRFIGIILLSISLGCIPKNVTAKETRREKLDQTKKLLKKTKERLARIKRMIKFFSEDDDPRAQIIVMQLKDLHARLAQNYTELKKLYKQLTKNKRRLGPLVYQPPIGQLPKRCQEKVQQFFNLAKAIWMYWMGPKMSKKLREYDTKFPKPKVIIRALYLLEINKKYIRCFDLLPELPPHRRRYVTIVKKLLQLRGIKQHTRITCNEIQKRVKSCKKNSSKNSWMCDAWGDSETCDSIKKKGSTNRDHQVTECNNNETTPTSARRWGLMLLKNKNDTRSLWPQRQMKK